MALYYIDKISRVYMRIQRDHNIRNKQNRLPSRIRRALPIHKEKKNKKTTTTLKKKFDDVPNLMFVTLQSGPELGRHSRTMHKFELDNIKSNWWANARVCVSVCVCIDLCMLCTRLYAWCMNFIFCDDGDGNGYIKPIIYFARALSQTHETKYNTYICKHKHTITHDHRHM